MKEKMDVCINYTVSKKMETRNMWKHECNMKILNQKMKYRMLFLISASLAFCWFIVETIFPKLMLV